MRYAKRAGKLDGAQGSRPDRIECADQLLRERLARRVEAARRKRFGGSQRDEAAAAGNAAAGNAGLEQRCSEG